MTRREAHDLWRDEVLLDFATSDEPMDERLAHFIGRFPAFEQEFRAVALDTAALEKVAAPSHLIDADAQAVSVEAERLSRAFDTLHMSAARPQDVLSNLEASEVRKLAKKANLSVPFFDKLKQRLIDVATIPSSFVSWLAAAMDVAEQDLLFSLGQPARAGMPSHFRLDGMDGSPGQSFAEAIATSALNDDQQAYLKGFLAASSDGGHGLESPAGR